MTELTASSSLAALRGGRLRWLGDLVKYGFASAAALALDYGLLLVCTRLLGLDYLVAAAIGFTSGLLLVYVLSIRVVFEDRRSKRPAEEFAGFVAIGVVGLLLNESLLYLFVEHVSLTPAVAKIPTAGLCFAFNFTLRRALLFSAPVGEARARA
jgi:putative flippase GtrA